MLNLYIERRKFCLAVGSLALWPLARGISAAAGRRGAGRSVAAHSNERLLLSRVGSSMADSPGGDGTRRSGRARRAASIGGEDFVDLDEVDRRERQAVSTGYRERLAAQRARGQARRETAVANRHDDSMNGMNGWMDGWN